jgi:hypothetical protein
MLYHLRERQDLPEFVIVGGPDEKMWNLQLDHYVSVPGGGEEEPKFLRSLGAKFRVYFPGWFRTNNKDRYASLSGSKEYSAVKSNSGAVLFIKPGKDGRITVAGETHDIASFTSLVMNDWHWTAGSIYRRIIGTDHMSDVPFTTDKFTACTFYDTEIESRVVTIIPRISPDSGKSENVLSGEEAENELPHHFREFVKVFASKPEKEIEETVYPLDDSFLFFTLGRLLTGIQGVNASKIKHLFRAKPETEILKNVPQIIGLGIGIKIGQDGRANALLLRFHQKGDDSSSLANESVWVGRPHKQRPRTIVWEISNSSPAYDIRVNYESLEALTSVVRNIFIPGLKHICIPKSIYDEVSAKKNGGGDPTPAPSGGTRPNSGEEGEIPPVSFDSPLYSVVFGGAGVFSPAPAFQGFLVHLFNPGSGMALGLMPAFI